MDRVEIKSLAKEKIKGNLWTIWKPLLIIFLIAFAASLIGQGAINLLGKIGAIINFVLVLAAEIFALGYYAWLMKFIRGEEADFNTIVDCIKNKGVSLFITALLVEIFVFLWSLLFIIPGIIKSFAYAMAMFIVLDTDLSGSDAIKESMKMMDGYKFDYFIFNLSFLGWIILTPFTLGILYIWLAPYMMVAQVIYYDKLKAKVNGTTYSTATVTEEKTVEHVAPVTTAEENTEVSAPSLGDVKIGGEDDTDPISDKE